MVAFIPVFWNASIKSFRFFNEEDYEHMYEVFSIGHLHEELT